MATVQFIRIVRTLHDIPHADYARLMAEQRSGNLEYIQQYFKKNLAPDDKIVKVDEVVRIANYP